MYRALLILLFLLSSLVNANESEPWVLKYGSWSSWGAKGDVWLNSNRLLVVSDGNNFQNIPCESDITEAGFLEINKIVQELIVKRPKNSMNEESKSCFDETRVNLIISLMPEKTEEQSQPLLMEQFSTMYGCNENQVDKLWVELAEHLNHLRKTRIAKCVNSPF